jgi:hypothetical protein
MNQTIIYCIEVTHLIKLEVKYSAMITIFHYDK